MDSLHAYEQLAPVRGRAGAVYREREVRPSLGNLTGRYRAGLPVMALYDRSEAVRGSLALPAPTLAGGCVPAPVAFLRPRSAVCRRALSPAVCAAAKNSALDHQMYLMSSAAIAQEPHFPQVMAENNALRTAATETTYYAAHNPELYFSAPGPSPAPARGATDLGAVQARVAGGGAGEQLFLSGHTRLGAVQSVAHLEPASLACTNLVLEARYELVWAGPRILQVAAPAPSLRHHLLLAGAGRGAARQHLPGAAAECQHQAAFQGEVSSPSPVIIVSITRPPQAVFTHSPPEGGAARQPRPRSGNPGYSAAAPLVFASRLGEGDAGPRFRLEPGGLRVWGDNGPSSLCAENAPAGPRFGLSTVSGCAVRLARPQLQRCAELRASVREIQRGLVRAEYVARLGNLDTTDPGNFVPVLQEEEEEEEEAGPGQEGDSESGPGCVVQAGLRVTVLTVAVPAEDGRAEPIQKINGLKVVPVYEKWLWRCKSKIKGSRKCDGFRDFMLWTEVEFLEIPNMWHHQNTSRFWLKQVCIGGYEVKLQKKVREESTITEKASHI